MPRCTLTPKGDGLALASPYDPGFVADFKAAVPPAGRAWDASRKVWVIAPQYGDAVAALCEQYFGARPSVPQALAAAAPEIKVFRLEYLGQCKPREGGAITAMGYADGAWSVIAPERVLRIWFEGSAIGATPDEAPAPRPETYYGLLGIKQDADDATIKAGYRRMARQWHPDACREPNAHEMFLAIRQAYNILSEPMLRKRYNAGLLFAAQDKAPRREAMQLAPPTYRAPLRCGMVVAEALPRLGRWELTNIIGWQDIVDLSGRVMVASWDVDAERIRVEWVTA
jgi:hypothetical protein